MPNRARQRGDYFERRTRAALESQGWLVVRSAGSLGCADLIALRAGLTPMLISCKVSKHLPRTQLLVLATAAEKAGAWGVLAWSLKPGWVGLEIVTRHGRARLPDHHMPPRKTAAITAQPDGLTPAGEQLALPYG